MDDTARPSVFAKVRAGPARLAALVAALLLAVIVAAPAGAAPEHYQLDTRQSQVGFEVDFNATRIRGKMPVVSADLTLDLVRVAASKVRVSVNAAGADTSFPFATEAMKSDSVLATKRFPEILFESAAVRPDGKGAQIDGKITIRGVTRPITLAARIYRASDSAPGDLQRLTIYLEGTIRRSDFGATGFADMVGDEVRLEIRAHILRDD